MSRRLTFWALIAALLLAGLRPAPAAWAAPARQDAQRFTFIVPSGFENEFLNFWDAYQGALNDAYDFYRVLYGVEPPLPVYIQVYAQRADLFDNNLLVTPLPAGGTHTHLGARQIALIAPWPEGYLVSARGLDAVRYELHNVFLSVAGANNLPAGVEIGLSWYVTASETDRKNAVSRLVTAQAAGTLYSWRALLDNPVIYADAEVGHPQAFAVMAFLADRYGYVSLVQFVDALGAGQTLDEALLATFGAPLDRLEQAWQEYLPGFLAGRWQYNALADYDLAPFRDALAKGAYNQVARALQAALPFLEASGQAAALEEARALLAEAQAGSAAGELVLQTRAALEAGLFARTLELAAQARTAYAALGSHAREAELAAYETRAQQVLALRAELDAAVAQYNAGDVAAAEPALLSLIPQLEAVGDGDRAAQAEGLIQSLYGQRQAAAAARTALAQRSLQICLAAVGVWFVAQVGRLVYRRWRRPAPGVL